MTGYVITVVCDAALVLAVSLYALIYAQASDTTPCFSRHLFEIENVIPRL